MRNLIIIAFLFVAMSSNNIYAFSEKPLDIICESNQSQLKDGIYYATMEYYDRSRQENVIQNVKVDVYSDFITDVYHSRGGLRIFSTSQKDFDNQDIKVSGGKIKVVKNYDHNIISAKAIIVRKFTLQTIEYTIKITELIHAY